MISQASCCMFEGKKKINFAKLRAWIVLLVMRLVMQKKIIKKITLSLMLMACVSLSIILMLKCTSTMVAENSEEECHGTLAGSG